MAATGFYVACARTNYLVGIQGDINSNNKPLGFRTRSGSNKE
jgi:hypothetical protein